MYKPKVGDLVYLEAYQSKTPYYVRVTRVDEKDGIRGKFAPVSRPEPIELYEGFFDEISVCRLIEAATGTPDQLDRIKESLTDLIRYIESSKEGVRV